MHHEEVEALTAKPKRSRNRIVMGCLIAFLVAVLLLVVGAILGWGAFVSFGISSDYDGFIASVKQSNLDDETKDALVGRLQKLRDRASDGEHTGFASWLDHDVTIGDIVDDGVITDAELIQLEYELDVLERDP